MDYTVNVKGQNVLIEGESPEEAKARLGTYAEKLNENENENK